MRLLLLATETVRWVWPEPKPRFVRVSATNWGESGPTLDDAIVGPANWWRAAPATIYSGRGEKQSQAAC